MNIRQLLVKLELRSKLQVAVAIALAGSVGGGVSAYQYWDVIGCLAPADIQEVLSTIRPVDCNKE